MANFGDVASIFGTIHEDFAFKLTVTDVDEALLRVASFRAVEELSAPFRYTVVVGTDPESTSKLEEALGRDATFVVEREGKPVRRVHGIVTDVSPDGAFIGQSQARVVLTLEPRLANLRYSGGFRIFQEKAVHEIVGELCQAEQIECLWYVHPVPQKRDYCTQLDESDLEFITRIASEEGMHYFFQHDEQKTKVVFVNEPKGYPEIEPDLSITFNETQGAVADEHVRNIQRGQRVRVGAFEHRDYDFLEPGKALVARAETKGQETTANSHRREWRDYPGRFTDKDGPGKSLAELRLDEARSDAAIVTGTAFSPRLVAGGTFSVSGHRDDGFNRALLLTRVEFDGAVQGALREAVSSRGSIGVTSFIAVPAEMPIHPQRVEKPPSRLQSARVVGPKDGEPFVDEHGRVKVQFFWDRDGQFNEKSSCWVRMMTPVAHADEGFWQAHKVGSEVVVGFIDDDIDRPMILGAVYNAAQPQTYPLPGQVAKSVWRTNSIPGNKGFNEITHDNSAGKEQIFVHAQRDLKEIVGHNHNTAVAANQSNSVGAHQSVSVGAAREVTVGANETTKIIGHRKETVDTGEDVTVTGNRDHTVKDGDDHLTVTTGNRTVDITAGNHTTNVKAGLTTLETKNWNAHATEKISLTGDQEIFVQQGGTKATFKGGNVTLEVAAETKVTHGGTTILIDNAGKVTITAAPELEVTCAGAQLLMAGGKVALTAPAEIKLAVGGSGITISPSSVSTLAATVKSTGMTLNEITGLLVKLN
ncbi:type VI secretion system tip protein VgrG [Pendulispora rubella]|uniref:Type VI secretion system tip protein VgrG n=1 Tax=Pendulispora rubella TaxID=2741070 RepID=A0ABZ2L2E9_9BACT